MDPGHGCIRIRTRMGPRPGSIAQWRCRPQHEVEELDQRLPSHVVHEGAAWQAPMGTFDLRQDGEFGWHTGLVVHRILPGELEVGQTNVAFEESLWPACESAILST